MDDLISKEIEQNRSYISENGWIKFYQKSKYLSKVWEIYKTEFDDVCGMIEKYNLFSFPKDEIALRPFKFIIDSLKNNFEEYYTDRKIIVKEKKIELENAEPIIIKNISFGERTEKHYVIENRVRFLIDDFFLLSDGFLIPVLDYFQNKYSITDKELQQRIDKRKKGSSKKSDDPTFIIYQNIIKYMETNENITVHKAVRLIFENAEKELTVEDFNTLYSESDLEAFYTKFLSFFKSNKEKYPTEYQIIKDHKQKKTYKKKS